MFLFGVVVGVVQRRIRHPVPFFSESFLGLMLTPINHCLLFLLDLPVLAAGDKFLVGLILHIFFLLTFLMPD